MPAQHRDIVQKTGSDQLFLLLCEGTGVSQSEKVAQWSPQFCLASAAPGLQAKAEGTRQAPPDLPLSRGLPHGRDCAQADQQGVTRESAHTSLLNVACLVRKMNLSTCLNTIPSTELIL